MFTDCIQFKRLRLCQKQPGHLHRIKNRKICQYPSFCLFLDKAHVKVRIVGYQGTAPAKAEKFRKNLFDSRSASATMESSMLVSSVILKGMGLPGLTKTL